jgi:hypothetical protein
MTSHRFPTANACTLPPHRARPYLEMLEDRTAPAVLVVSNLDDAGAGSLREALTSAVGTAENDQIVFAADLQGGAINLGTALPAIDAGGDLSIIGPGGVSGGITVNRSTGAGPFRIFEITADAGAVILMNLTVSNGRVEAQDGGGILNRGTATLTNVLVTGNTAGGAGADGGGIANRGTLTLNNTTVTYNTAVQFGGGISNSGGGTLTIHTGSRITGNTSQNNGGGLHAIGTGTVTIMGTTIAGNAAVGGTGGGIDNIDNPMSIRSSTISGNAAPIGGGIRTFLGVLEIANSTLASNLSRTGGGLEVAGAGDIVTITNTTIARNSATDDGGGIRRAAGTVMLNNSIVTLNVAADNPNISGAITSNFTRVGGLFQLGPLQDNGGPTFTLAPPPGSPVIDAGSNALAIDPATAAPLTTDQRGFPRIIGGTVDQGAVESFSSSATVRLALSQRDAEGMLQPLTGGMTSTARTVTLTATVAGTTTGAPIPPGSVLFFDDTTPNDPSEGPVQLSGIPIPIDPATGTATLPNVALAAGLHSLFARLVPSSSVYRPAVSPAQRVQAGITDTVGVFDPMGIAFQLLNQNTTTSTGPDFGYSFGSAGSLPVVGNWTGTGMNPGDVSYPGVVVNIGGVLQWTLSDDNPPVLPNLGSFVFGVAGQIPIAGDWDGDGTTGIGVFGVDPATGLGQFLLRNTPSEGAPDFAFDFGGAPPPSYPQVGPGFLPVVGNFDDDAADEVGVYNPATGEFLLATDARVTTTPPLLTGAPITVTGVAGPNSRPVAGDWDGDPTTPDGIGVFFPQPSGFGGFLLRSTPSTGAPDVNEGNVILAGLGNWLPLVGNWGVAPGQTNELLSLLASAGQGPGAEALRSEQLPLAVRGALHRLQTAGASPEVLNALLRAEVVVADLPDGWLGAADVLRQRVLIDIDAAGHGWFVDVTLGEDEEFSAGRGEPISAIEGRMDLLTVVLHEMGHLTGHDHDAEGLMAASLSAGVRHTDALDALFGSVLGLDGTGPPHRTR